MKAISFSKTRRNLSATMIQTVEDKAPVMIIRRNGESRVLMSTDEYNSLEETAWLLRSPKNARRLMDAIESLLNGDGTERNVIE
ncbi:YoeB-YefM toxin-antitoxin system antitoxin YefM [Pantoea vagans]|uniref:YoeB-YefM toxin-antitoxin system antitoxin YefM n=1 Tax=Pantoea vagans TaxID=470934 RepID=UPI0028E699C7|nr:YoeB-YefM toxin-antitoxin system antitoxin YefM [Pantoea vagans]